MEIVVNGLSILASLSTIVVAIATMLCHRKNHSD